MQSLAEMKSRRSASKPASKPASVAASAAIKPASTASKPASTASKPASSASKPASAASKTASVASKPASAPKRARKAKAVASRANPAIARVAAKTELLKEFRAQRRSELCGLLPGGTDAYYYQERCVLKKQNAELMRRNRNAVSFVNKITLELPILDRIKKEKKPDGKSPTDKEMAVALLQPKAVEKCVAFMTSPENNTAFPDPDDRLKAAMEISAKEYPDIATHPLPFRKVIAASVCATFAAAAKNVKDFKGRPAMRKGKKA